MVPVSVCYEKEPSFELFNKSSSSISSAFDVLGLLMGQLAMGPAQKNGQVRINFGQPFSLKEYIDTNESKKQLEKMTAAASLVKHLTFGNTLYFL